MLTYKLHHGVVLLSVPSRFNAQRTELNNAFFGCGYAALGNPWLALLELGFPA